MAYATYNKYRNRMNRRFTRRARTARTRRAPRRRARYSRRRKTSTRSVLNLTSTKKRDTMVQFAANGANTPAGGQIGIPPNPAGDTSTRVNAFLYCPSMRIIAQKSNIGDRAARTSTTCFAKGFAEAMTFTTTGGDSWQWRRIVLTAKGGDRALGYWRSTSTSGSDGAVIGYTRLTRNLTALDQAQSTAEWAGLQSVLFRGTKGIDWTDAFTAPVDTTRCSLRSDSRTTIRSGNESGTTRTFKRWYPVNKNLVYDDEENGDDEDPRAYSVTSRAGVGDMYVIDLFKCSNPTSSQILSWTTTGTWYWHEK